MAFSATQRNVLMGCVLPGMGINEEGSACPVGAVGGGNVY